jgi:hypothetical protein
MTAEILYIKETMLNKMNNTTRQLILNKGAQKYIFRYDAGAEDQLLDALIEEAKNQKTDFDWFDAAVLSFKLTQSLIGQADTLLYDKQNYKFSLD